MPPPKRLAGRPPSAAIESERKARLTAFYRREYQDLPLRTIAFDLGKSVATTKRWIGEARGYPEAADFDLLLGALDL